MFGEFESRKHAPALLQRLGRCGEVVTAGLQQPCRNGLVARTGSLVAALRLRRRGRDGQHRTSTRWLDAKRRARECMKRLIRHSLRTLLRRSAGGLDAAAGTAAKRALRSSERTGSWGRRVVETRYRASDLNSAEARAQWQCRARLWNGLPALLVELRIHNGDIVSSVSDGRPVRLRASDRPGAGPAPLPPMPVVHRGRNG